MRPSALTKSSIAVCCLVAVAIALGGESVAERSVFPLEEVSGFVEGAGHFCLCSEQAEPNVAYPAFSSEKPVYGVMRVDKEMGNEQSGTPYPFAIDESGGTGTGYDRLYIDLDRNGSLSGKKPLTPLQDPPAGAVLKHEWIAQQTCFDYVVFSSGTTATAVHPVETMPRLLISNRSYATLTFVATKARKGEIEIARRKYGATLVNSYPLSTCWDRPGITVKLEPRNRLARVPHWPIR